MKDRQSLYSENDFWAPDGDRTRDLLMTGDDPYWIMLWWHIKKWRVVSSDYTVSFKSDVKPLQKFHVWKTLEIEHFHM